MLHLHRDLAALRIDVSESGSGRLSWLVLGEDVSGAYHWLADGETGPFDSRLQLVHALTRSLVNAGALHLS